MTTPQDPYAPRPDQPSGASPVGGSPAGDGPQYTGGQQYGTPEPQYGSTGSTGSTPQYGGQPQYGQQYGGQQPQYGGGDQYGGATYGSQQTGHRNGLGIAALVVGILALLSSWLVVGGLLGIVAIILGIIGWRRAKRREASNGGLAIAGIVLGVISVLVAGVILAIGAAVWNSDEFSNYRECAEAATSEQELQDCNSEFEQTGVN